jgi:hypothetical protein
MGLFLAGVCIGIVIGQVGRYGIERLTALIKGA